MSLQSLGSGWYRFGAGKKWRCVGPKYLCEVGDEGNTPNFCHLPKTVAAVRRMKAFYEGKLQLGQLDEYGYGLDVLVANAFTESLGSVPSKLSEKSLRAVNTQNGPNAGTALGAVIHHISGAGGEKYLERREPGYVNPICTPGRVSVGSHHVLISTALGLSGKRYPKGSLEEQAAITDLVCGLPANSLDAARLAIKYFNSAYARHHNHPPLLAASYNAGSPRLATGNDWNLVQYGAHIDRWVGYFNTSRSR